MTDRVWMSSIHGNSGLGDKAGTRYKLYDEPWTPAQHEQLLLPDHIHKAMGRNADGFSATRHEMPEKCAIWQPNCFKQTKAIFPEAGYYVITGELIDIFSKANLGEGGLVSLPFFEADLETPVAQEFFLLNVGARKRAFLPELTEDARKFMICYETGQQLWHVNKLIVDGVVSVSSSALQGPDLWVDENVNRKLFMSDWLGSAITKTKAAKEWRLLKCNVVGLSS